MSANPIVVCWRVVCWLVIAGWVCAVSCGLAQESPSKSASERPNKKQLEQQIFDLSAASFNDRERAASELANAGESVVPLLESTVESNEFEARLRALELLRKIYQANDFAASFAAGDALRRLALHQQELISSYASDALQAQYGLAIDRLKKKGAVFTSENQIVELGESWNGTQKDILDLRWLQELRTLRLSKPQLKDETLGVLRWLGQLFELVILDAQITDQGLTHLQHVPDLTILHLARTQVTDDGVQRLLHLGSLCSLDLSGTQVSAAGVKSLSALEKLQYLDLRHLPITVDDLTQLRIRLPKTHILIDDP
jgi:hypothetical protein